jgi:hypothetical protein
MKSSMSGDATNRDLAVQWSYSSHPLEGVIVSF